MPGDGWRAFRRFLGGDGPAPQPPSLAVLVAHPDDETVGAGALLGRLAPEALAAVVHATSGAPRDLAWAPAAKGDRERYARERRKELECALALVGIPAERLVDLGLVDQEVVLALPALSERIADLFLELAPELVLTLAYEGGHPDHDAVAFAAHAAVELLRRRGRGGPELAEMALYHAGEGGLVPGEFLPTASLPPGRGWLGKGGGQDGGGCGVHRSLLPNGEAPLLTSPLTQPSPSQGGGTRCRHGEGEIEFHLTPTEIDRKRRMIAAFLTQEETLRPFLPSRPERFRPAPAYRFTEPPHPGPLQYEIWGFPLTGEAWRDHARQALRALDLPEDSPL